MENLLEDSAATSNLRLDPDRYPKAQAFPAMEAREELANLKPQIFFGKGLDPAVFPLPRGSDMSTGLS
jgi:hypothetical protein